MDAVETYDKLCSRLRSSAVGVIGIEGFCTSGKSWLADRLGRDLPAAVVHVDDYCTPRDNPPPYADGVDIPRLKQALRQLSPTCFSVVEGICLRGVLAKCGVIAKTYVYVKLMSSNGLWHDGLHLEAHEEGNGIPGDDQEPHASDFSYHSNIRPHEKADLIFLWVAEQ
jgi:hypothetical protein